jgi:hypothetical protein
VPPTGAVRPSGPPLPLQIIHRRPEGNEADAAEFHIEAIPSLEPFGELPRLRFDQQPELSIEPDPYHEHLKFNS